MITNICIIFLNIALGVFFWQLQKEYKIDNRHRYIWMACTILALQSGLRHVAVGTDTFAYQYFFDIIKQQTWSDVWQIVCNYYGESHIGKDPGYPVIEKLFSMICPFYRGWLLAIAGFFFWALGRFLCRHTTRIADVMLGLTIYSSLFYSFFSITGHRQTIATACCLLAYEYIVPKKLFRFLFIILLASTIHQSCLIFIILYPFVNFYRGTGYYWGGVLALPFFFLFQSAIWNFCRNIAYDIYSYSSSSGTPTFTAMLLIVVIFVGLQLRLMRKQYPEVDLYGKALICALFFLPMTWFNPSAMRIVQYFSFFIILLVPMAISVIQPIPFRRVLFLTAIICLPLLYARGSATHTYRLWFQQMALGSNYWK